MPAWGGGERGGKSTLQSLSSHSRGSAAYSQRRALATARIARERSGALGGTVCVRFGAAMGLNGMTTSSPVFFFLVLPLLIGSAVPSLSFFVSLDCWLTGRPAVDKTPMRPRHATACSAAHAGTTAVLRVDVQAGPERLPVLEVRLPGSTTLGDLRQQVARHFRIPVEVLELVREVGCIGRRWAGRRKARGRKHL